MSFGIKELVVILIIVMLMFGTKKIKGVGSDVGGWIRDFRKAMKEEPAAEEEPEAAEELAEKETNRVIEGESHTETEQV